MEIVMGTVLPIYYKSRPCLTHIGFGFILYNSSINSGAIHAHHPQMLKTSVHEVKGIQPYIDACTEEENKYKDFLVRTNLK